MKDNFWHEINAFFERKKMFAHCLNRIQLQLKQIQ